MLRLRVLLTENELADEFVSSFRSRRLAEKFFYWFPLSVRAWLALCADGAYRNYVRSHSLVTRTAPTLAAQVAPGALDVVSLGAGQGDKDLILLQALGARPAQPAYRPVDASQALLEIACGAAVARAIPTEGVKADFTDPAQLAALAPAPDAPPRLVLLLGNTLGAFDPLAQARVLAASLRPGDQLLVDGELAGAETMAGYDNPVNRRFAWAPLLALGLGEADGALAFEAVPDPRRPGLMSIRKSFTAGRDLTALLGGEALSLARGERVEMNHSYKYDAATFLGILEDAGLAVRWRATSDDGRFLMALAGRA
jgi:L-histidine Nalpha-methyltransferase